jgi:hypothetical protein
MNSDLASILASLDAAVVAGEAACAALQGHDDPFPRVLLRQMQQSTGIAREARDTLKRAILETSKP